MSNSNIVARLATLANDYEHGRINLSFLANQLVGHAEALEGMEYRRVKEAHMVQAQLMQAIEIGRELDVDRQTLLNWLRGWIANIPVAAA